MISFEASLKKGVSPGMSNNILEVDQLSVQIEDKQIITDISLTLPRGSICAIVGHNGAGKSVTLKSIMGLQPKSAGTVLLNGVNLDEERDKYKYQFAYIPEEPLLFTELTVYQHFQLYGTSYGVESNSFDAKVEHFVRMFELEDKLEQYPSDLSKGMRQKVNIISALLVETPLLIVDEPFIGLDVHAIDQLEQELRRRANSGMSILLSSHVIERVRKLCDTFVLLKNGKIALQGAARDLQSFEVSK
jgi:ABC-2 type transport system ATP-binding protein